MDYCIEPQVWERIYSFLRGVPSLHTKNEKRLRQFIEAIWYITRGGCQWRLLPTTYGNWRAIHRRFKRWAERDIWRDLLRHAQVEPDLQAVMIDATIVRAHACAAGYAKGCHDQEALGRNKGGFTTKIHALVDGLGNPLEFILTPGQRNDITQAEKLTENISHTAVIADKGYDSHAFLAHLSANSCTSVIPPRSNRKQPRDYDKELYRERHLIECFFGKIKHYRRVFSRFDKTALVYAAFLSFVGALIWLR